MDASRSSEDVGNERTFLGHKSIAEIQDSTIKNLREDLEENGGAGKGNTSCEDTPMATEDGKGWDLNGIEGSHACITTSIEDEPKPRLVIEELVLINFKSYAGRQVIGPFNTSFSAIIGPNGSGKSNVIDSLLFVFGFRASKLRHAKLSNVIHKSEAYPDLPYARVEVHFAEVIDKEGGTIRISDSELVVAREVNRANGSTYFINGKKVTYSDATALLKRKGIDLDHKRFLILQGEVESIALMKPKAEGDSDDGLLEYLEDIIGTSKYKKLIEDADILVAEIKDEASEKHSRFQVTQENFGMLDEQRRAVEAFMKKDNERTVAKSTLLQYRRYYAKLDYERQIREKQELEEMREKETADFAAESKAVADQESSIAQDSETLKILKSNMLTKGSEVRQMELACVRLEEKIQQNKSRQEKLEKNKKSAEKELFEAQQWLGRLDHDVQSNTDQLSLLRTNLDAAENVLKSLQEGLKSKTQPYTEKLERLQQQVDPWRAKIQEQESIINEVESSVHFAANREKEDKDKLDKIMERLKSVVSDGSEAHKTVQSLERQSNDFEEQARKLASEMKVIKSQIAELDAQVKAQRVAVVASRDSMVSLRQKNRLERELMAQRENDRLAGLYGRLGSLGTIDQKYDVAVSTAAPQLDDFVVDCVETGQNCIEHLRRNNLGRARFIVLDKLARRNLSQIKTPENVPRLFDLIRPNDPKFAPAFYSVLQDTLVATDIAQARRVAYGERRFRVVTIDGSLIEASGAMSGGGRPSHGRMSSQKAEMVSPVALAEMESDLAANEKSLQRLKYTESETAQRLSEISKTKPQLEVELSKARLSVDVLKQQMTDLKTQRDAFKARLKENKELDEKNRLRAQSQLDEAIQAKANLESESSQLEAEIKQLQNQILEVGGLKLRMQSSKVQDIRDSIQQLTAQAEDQQRNKTKKAAIVTRNEAVVRESQARLAEHAKTEQQLVQELEDAKLLRRQKEEEQDELKAQILKTEARFAAAQEMVAARRRDLSERRNRGLEIQSKLEECGSAVHKIGERLGQIEHDLAGLVLHDLRIARDLRASEAADEDMRTEETEGALPELTADEICACVEDDLVAVIEKLAAELDDMHGVNFDVLEEYREAYGEYTDRKASLSESLAKLKEAKERSASLKRRRHDEFMAGFTAISQKLKEMYKLITMGGNAELELVDSLDPFSEGVLFSVMPPKKSWRNISNLSGGEKTLSSLALVFALHHYKPTPLYVMDEIDAALDFRNVSIVANYIKERTSNGQFIVISLRNNMFELASRLIGIFKQHNMTHSITLNNVPVAHAV